MAKVNEIQQTKKKFIPVSVALHNRAIDYLGLMQQAIIKIGKLRKVVEGIDCDMRMVPEFQSVDIMDLRSEAVIRHDNAVLVYRWLLSRYLANLSNLYTESLYDNTHLYNQLPYALKNVACA